jgi:hypothetical protein
MRMGSDWVWIGVGLAAVVLSYRAYSDISPAVQAVTKPIVTVSNAVTPGTSSSLSLGNPKQSILDIIANIGKGWN